MLEAYRHTYLPDLIRNRPTLPLQYFNLQQFRYDLFGFVSLSNHAFVLLKWDIPVPVGGPRHWALQLALDGTIGVRPNTET